MLYEILVDFPGSQDGTVTEQFKAGTRRELSKYLAGCIDPAWARKVDDAPVIEQVAPEVKIGTLKMKRK